MFNDDSYKLSLVFAIAIHLLLVFFLVARSATSKAVVSISYPHDFISATAINERDFDDQMRKKVVAQKKPVVKNQQEKVSKSAAKNKKIRTMMRKNLLDEQAKEIAELKKQKQDYKKELAAKKKQQMQQALENQILAEQKQLAAQREQEYGRRIQGEVDKYKSLIIQSISSEWIIPEGADSDSVSKLLINLAPGGVVLDVQLVKSSGNLALDRSAQAAVLKASPLPVPEDAKILDRVRTISLTVRPEGIVGG